MHWFELIPIWVSAVTSLIAAAAAFASLLYLAKYTKSARDQVEGIARPIIVFYLDNKTVCFKNIGNGPALNLRWELGSKNGYIPAFSQKDSETMDTGTTLIYDKKTRVIYSSISGRQWESVGTWTNSRIELSVREIPIRVKPK